jgi:hypothetical protein
MLTVEVAQASEAGGQVTIWLPVRWPVVTLSVMRRDTQVVVWQIAHESFYRVAVLHDGIELHIDHISVEAIQQEAERKPAPTNECSALRYGEAPEGMGQFVPSDGAPPALESGVAYVVSLREHRNAGIRRFELQIA